MATDSLECLRAGTLTSRRAPAVSGVAPRKSPGGPADSCVSAAEPARSSSRRPSAPSPRRSGSTALREGRRRRRRHGDPARGHRERCGPRSRLAVQEGARPRHADSHSGRKPGRADQYARRDPSGASRQFAETLRRAREYGIDAVKLRGLSNDLARRMAGARQRRCRRQEDRQVRGDARNGSGRRL